MSHSRSEDMLNFSASVRIPFWFFSAAVETVRFLDLVLVPLNDVICSLWCSVKRRNEAHCIS